MGREEFEQLSGNTFKRKAKRRVGLFIDGTGLDRATRRLNKKVDLQRLVASIASGLEPEVARYYTLIPNEDDARQFAFLDAVERAGLEVVVKRLPPKGVKRQVSMDVHMAADLVAYSMGGFNEANRSKIQGQNSLKGVPPTNAPLASTNGASTPETAPLPDESNIKRLTSVVCPTREMSYAIYIANLYGVETTLADFGLYGTSDGTWKGVDKWVDLSNSEVIWR